MTFDWNTMSLGDLCDFRAGSVFKPVLQGQTSGDFPFVKVSDMNLPVNAVRIQDANNWVSAADLRELRAKPFPPGTVVFAKIGEALRQNRLRQVARETIVDNNMMGAIPRTDRVDPCYFYYALSQFDFSEIAQGTALPYLTVGSLSALTLDVPPLPEQRAIAHILGTLDDKIENLRRQNETLEAMARALFQAWFVDFEPVRAKIEGRWRRGESLPGLPAHLYDLFPDRLVESELGEIPEGWLITALAEAIEIVDGRTLSSSKRDDGGRFQVFGANGPIAQTKDAWVNSPCIILGKIGTCGALHRSPVPCWVTNNAFAVLPGRSRSLEFAWHILKSIDFSNYVGGSANPYMPLKNFGHHLIVLPPPEVLETFQLLAGSLRSRVESAEEQSRTLAALCDTLLPKLISGELRVKDAERFLQERGL